MRPGLPQPSGNSLAFSPWGQDQIRSDTCPRPEGHVGARTSVLPPSVQGIRDITALPDA